MSHCSWFHVTVLVAAPFQPELVLLCPELRVKKPKLRLSVPVQGVAVPAEAIGGPLSALLRARFWPP